MADSAMTSVFYFRLVELKAGPKSALRKQSPRARGAIVDCAVPACSLSEAQTLLRHVVTEDDYSLKSFDDVIELGNQRSWLIQDIPTEVMEIALRALESAEPAYGVFRCW